MVCARASWQRASRRSVFGCGCGWCVLGEGGGWDWGLDLDLELELASVGGGVLELGVVVVPGVVAGVVGAVWRVLASWQSARAARKRLMAM